MLSHLITATTLWGATIIPILQMREVKYLIQGHETSE